MSYLVGIDVGTTNAKVGVFANDGTLLAMAQGTYPTLRGEEAGQAEQSPDAWWSVVCDALRRTLRTIDASRVKAVCVTGQGPTVVACDAAGEPVCNALTWMDTRVACDRDALIREGLYIGAYSSMPTVRWLKRRCSQDLERARWLLSVWDYIAFRLCGRAAASSFHNTVQFPADAMRHCGVDISLAAPGVPLGEQLGRITPQASAETTLPTSAIVISGENDGLLATAGAGVLEPGRSLDPGGTAGGLSICTATNVDAPELCSEPSLAPGRMLVGGTFSGLGTSIEWFAQVLGGGSFESITQSAARSPPGARGILFLPHLNGERAPFEDPAARGVFFGLSLDHDHRHLARAVFESTAFALRHLAEPYQAAGGRLDEVRVCGAQASNDLLNQIKADVLGLPVTVPAVPEAAMMGAAIVGGVGGGVLPDIAGGAEGMVRIARTFAPDPRTRELYARCFALYQRLYPDLAEAFQQLRESGLAGATPGPVGFVDRDERAK